MLNAMKTSELMIFSLIRFISIDISSLHAFEVEATSIGMGAAVDLVAVKLLFLHAQILKQPS